MKLRMKKKFVANVSYYGSLQVVVEAETPEEAKALAQQKVGDLPDEEFVIDHFHIDNVQEEKKGENG